jgi:hypothetical protein
MQHSAEQQPHVWRTAEMFRMPCPGFCSVAAQAMQARAYTESSTGKEAQLSDELSAVRDELEAALADKAELETALGLLDRNSKAQVEQLQVCDPSSGCAASSCCAGS